MSKVMRTHTGITEWNGDYWCDSCNRRIPKVKNVDGMDFCPKCYQETFGETDKDRKICDLEAKLAEKEKENEKLNTINNLIRRDYRNMFCSDYCSRSGGCDETGDFDTCPYKSYWGMDYEKEYFKDDK